jgi:hypothetical protein
MVAGSVIYGKESIDFNVLHVGRIGTGAGLSLLFLGLILVCLLNR